MTYAERLADVGGMANCGGHLGVMVAPHESARHCPRGWVFLELGKATPAEVSEALAVAGQGRKAWPEKVST